MTRLDNIRTKDARDAIEIADRIWWVGHYLKDDQFQCHVYLIEHGDQSVLLDPGSKLTFNFTLKKIEHITAFDNIRYFVCHHQDPDIAGSLPTLDEMVTRDDAVIVTHWRAQELLKHYDLKLPFWRIEDHDWTLDLGGRKLSFVFTPYAHFPGAFVTFDQATGILFSSDIFGGFTDEFSLVAKDESYFECLRPFHEHYIPSRDIMRYTLNKLRKLPLKMIAPQHGSIIPEHLINFIFKNLAALECGIYLLAQEDSELHHLSTLNKVLRDITDSMMTYRAFPDIAAALVEITRRLLPVKSIEFFAITADRKILHLAPETHFRGCIVNEIPSVVARELNGNINSWRREHRHRYTMVPRDSENEAPPSILIPLFSPSIGGGANGASLVHMEGDVDHYEELEEIIDQMSVPLQVAVERETIYRTLDMEREKYYASSIRDPLSGLFTRFYMQDVLTRLLSINDRDPSAQVGVAMIDIDHFKKINDTFGHNQGDQVLKRVAAVLLETVRAGDVPVRLGGEEFAVFVVGMSAQAVALTAERLRKLVEDIQFDAPMADNRVTASFGVAVRKSHEPLTQFMARADSALYEAKNQGRNKVCLAVE